VITTALELAAIAATLAIIIRPECHSARNLFFPPAAATLIVVFAVEGGLMWRLLRRSSTTRSKFPRATS
jgi:hypothetical protein